MANPDAARRRELLSRSRIVMRSRGGNMRHLKKITLAVAAGIMVLASMGFYAADHPSMRRWLVFYAWKAIGGKARGGDCVALRDICIHYEIYGAGPPVLVLHGGLGSIEGMSYQIRTLASAHLVIAADSRGHGRSTDSDVPLSYALMADDMANLLDYLRIWQVDVIGWSDGAIIGLDLAMRRPSRVRRLVVISANYDVSGLIGSSSASSETSAVQVPPMPLRYRLFAPIPAHWAALYTNATSVHDQRTRPHQMPDAGDGGRVRCH
jgi:alpha-beta hydrolase superfamily lysophospholipase